MTRGPDSQGRTSTWAKLAELPFEVAGYSLEPHEQRVSASYLRLTTVVVLSGGNGLLGRGEDVSYTARDQEALRAAGPVLPLAGRWTLTEFSDRLSELELWPEPPSQAAHRDYRRWAFESAALDLALAQSGVSLAHRLAREPRPVRFVASIGLGRSPSLAPIEALRRLVPDLRFKLDASSAWSDTLVRELAELGCVDTVDFKGYYSGTAVDQVTDPGLYARVIEGLPECWLEDPALDEQTTPLFDGHWERVTWDAPIHSWRDVDARLVAPRTINVKPSRCGRLEEVFALYDYCAAQGIAMYGGGQFELACGRGQVQYLASLFHPELGNDVAPVEYNRVERPAELPASPLRPSAARTGFQWG